MRKSRLLVIALLLVAPAVFAQRQNNFTVFLNQFEMEESRLGRHWYSNYGAAFESSFTPHFSAQISVGSEKCSTASDSRNISRFRSCGSVKRWRRSAFFWVS